MTCIFISHSHKDKEIAKKLVDYLLAALSIDDYDIRCTSVPGYMLPPGTNIESHLKQDINADIALIGLLTQNGLRSQWVLFELGASWGMGKLVIPILGTGLSNDDLPGPLKNYTFISIEDELVNYSLNEMIRELAAYLKIKQKYGSSEEPKRDEFINQLRACQSKLPDLDESRSPQILEQPESNRFKIALSFPGEHRDFVLKVAESLAARLTRQRVFYDEWYETELLGVGGDLKLQSMYSQADLVVPFFSQHYSKPWCSLEWETIRALLLKRRKEDAVIPVHLDDTDIPGWSAVNFGIRLRGRIPQKIADIILQALAMRNPTNVSQQERIEELTEKLEAIEAASSQEKEELEQNYQRQKQDKERSLSQIKQLEEQLEQERSIAARKQANLQASIKAAQEKVVEKESVIAQLQEQIEQLTSSQQNWRKGENWLNYDELTFNLNAPQAHLPSTGAAFGLRVVVVGGLFFVIWLVFLVV